MFPWKNFLKIYIKGANNLNTARFKLLNNPILVSFKVICLDISKVSEISFLMSFILSVLYNNIPHSKCKCKLR